LNIRTKFVSINQIEIKFLLCLKLESLVDNIVVLYNKCGLVTKTHKQKTEQHS